MTSQSAWILAFFLLKEGKAEPISSELGLLLLANVLLLLAFRLDNIIR